MKKIELLVSQTGEENVIVQGDLRVKINGKFVQNCQEIIIKEAIELNFGCRLRIEIYSTSSFLRILTKSGYEKKFKVNSDLAEFSYRLSKLELNRRLEELVEVLHEIEDWVFNIHSKTCNFVLTAEYGYIK